MKHTDTYCSQLWMDGTVCLSTDDDIMLHIIVACLWDLSFLGKTEYGVRVLCMRGGFLLLLLVITTLGTLSVLRANNFLPHQPLKVVNFGRRHLLRDHPLGPRSTLSLNPRYVRSSSMQPFAQHLPDITFRIAWSKVLVRSPLPICIHRAHCTIG